MKSLHSTQSPEARPGVSCKRASIAVIAAGLFMASAPIAFGQSLPAGTANLTAAFAPTSINSGGTSTLTVTITAQGAVNGVALSGTLTNLTIATPSNGSTSCGSGTVTATSGGTSFSMSGGGNLGNGANCSVSVDVTGTQSGSASGSVTSSNSATANWSANLTVNTTPVRLQSFDVN